MVDSKRHQAPPRNQRKGLPPAPPVTSQTSVAGYHGVAQSARFYSPEEVKVNNVSLRESARTKPSYEELHSKFSKAKNKTQEMKSVLNEYAMKMREMQERMESQEIMSREKHRKQSTARDRMR